MPATSSSAPIPVEERLFSLVLALLATRQGLTKAEILSTVQGYRQRYSASGGNAALERQFERDKDDIRELGVPLETIESPGQAGNNQLLRYRIPKGRYDLPADIDFTPQELTLLSLAATVWREGSLSAESRRALLKLRSLGTESDEPLLGYAPRVRVRDAAFAPLSAALERHAVVRFSYLKPGDRSARARAVAPLALVQHEGRWHLFALDCDAHAERTFLLSRIVGEVTVTDTDSAVPPGDHAAHAIAQLDRLWQDNVADIEVGAGTDAAVRFGNRYGADGPIIQVHYTDLDILADELAGFGPEVFVHAPKELRAAVLARLRRAWRAHTGEAADA